MEGNKDAADVCYQRAVKATSVRDMEKAVRYLERSIRLYKTTKAEEFLAKVQTKMNSKASKHSTPTSNLNSKSSNGSIPRTQSDPQTLSKEKADFTKNQVEAVTRVHSKKDYYKILGVEKDADETEIKKAYRKLALSLHPDKNKAPGATDAFKAVGKAFAIISDKEKRRQYDLYGNEDNNSHVRYRQRRRYEDENIDADDVFRMFFGGGFPSDNVRVFRRGNTYYYDRRRRNSEETNDANVQQGGFGALLQIMPLLIIILMSLMSSWLVSDPAYQLSMRGEYSVKRATQKLRIEYFVKPSFSQEYKSYSLRHIEKQVEDDFIENLRVSCYHERVNKENLRRKGVYFGSSELLEQSEKYKTPSCDRLEKIFNRLP